MIAELTIRNFGLIDELSIAYKDGLNIFTGETGAGKSILIDALRFVLGERLSSSQIRDRSKPCTVECVFELPEKYFKEYPDFTEFTEDGDTALIISRTTSPDGKNKIKLNGFSLTVAQLKDLGDHLVDFHGPNDHQMLLEPGTHLHILDKLCDISDMQKEYRKTYTQYSVCRKELENIKNISSTRDRELDLLSHQIKELEQVPLDPLKYRENMEEQTRADNVQNLRENVERSLSILDNGTVNLSDIIASCFTPIEKLSELDESCKGFYEKLNDLQSLGDDLIAEIKDYAASIGDASFDPDEISRRSDIYYDILKKYGPSIEDAVKFYDEIKTKYDLLADIEQNTFELEQRLKKLKNDAVMSAEKISKLRKKAAASMKKTIEKELKDLGIKHVEFECRVDKDELTENGTDLVTFYISPNAGEEMKPLSEIVSSGEAARLMLAMKKALIKVDPIPVLIFDEIDAQIGGRLGTITGEKLKELAVGRQVILITHLPQIASYGEKHFLVSKKVVNNRTNISVADLSYEERVSELADMLGGAGKASVSTEHAREMLDKAAAVNMDIS